MTAKRLVVGGTIALVLAACTIEARAPTQTAAPAETTTTIPATTTTTLSIEDATANFRTCLIDQGLAVGEIPFDSTGRPRLELALVDIDFGDAAAIEALTSCSDLLTRGALDLTVWPQLQEQVQLVLESFSDCMRSHGVLTFPDPVNPFVGVGGPFSLDEIPFDDPDLEAAVAICSDRVSAAAK